MWRELNEIIRGRYLEQCLARTKCSVNASCCNCCCSCFLFFLLSPDFSTEQWPSLPCLPDTLLTPWYLASAFHTQISSFSPLLPSFQLLDLTSLYLTLVITFSLGASTSSAPWMFCFFRRALATLLFSSTSFQAFPWAQPLAFCCPFSLSLRCLSPDLFPGSKLLSSSLCPSTPMAHSTVNRAVVHLVTWVCFLGLSSQSATHWLSYKKFIISQFWRLVV